MLVLLEGRPVRPAPVSTAAGFGDTETDGPIGIWHFFPNLDKYVEGLKETTDFVGIDHVSIGTDQVAPGSVQDCSQWVQPTD